VEQSEGRCGEGVAAGKSVNSFRAGDRLIDNLPRICLPLEILQVDTTGLNIKENTLFVEFTQSISTQSSTKEL
jgi:hypothetical protein